VISVPKSLPDSTYVFELAVRTLEIARQDVPDLHGFGVEHREVLPGRFVSPNIELGLVGCHSGGYRHHLFDVVDRHRFSRFPRAQPTGPQVQRNSVVCNIQAYASSSSN
jgi:hypothetical protein